MRVAPLLSRLTSSPLALCPRRGPGALRAIHDHEWEPGQEIPIPEEPAPGVIRVHGVLVHRGLGLGPELDAWCGIVAYDEIRRQLAEAASDPKVSAVVLDVDSPGGGLFGLLDAVDAVRAAAAAKPVVAVANELACSAAYVLAAAADEVIASRTGYVGSVGVYRVHEDLSGALAQAGIRTEFIYAGEKKVDGNETQPLSPRVRAEIQAEVDESYRMITESVAASRDLDVAAVRATEADVYRGQDALDVGFVDALGNLESAQVRARELAAARAPKSEAIDGRPTFGNRQTFRRSA